MHKSLDGYIHLGPRINKICEFRCIIKNSTIAKAVGGGTLTAGSIGGACAGTMGSSPNSVIKSFSEKYKSTFTSSDLSSEKCTQEMYAIDLDKNPPYKSSKSVNNNETGCLFIDIKKHEDKAVLVKVEMTLLKKENDSSAPKEGLILGTIFVNTTRSKSIGVTNWLRQTNWFIKLGRNNLNSPWEVVDGWVWGENIVTTDDNVANQLKLEFRGSVLDDSDRAWNPIIIKDPCYVDDGCDSEPTNTAFAAKYKWVEDASGRHPCMDLTIKTSETVADSWISGDWSLYEDNEIDYDQRYDRNKSMWQRSTDSSEQKIRCDFGDEIKGKWQRLRD